MSLPIFHVERHSSRSSSVRATLTPTPWFSMSKRNSVLWTLYITSTSYGIGKFNAYIKDLVDSLTAHRQVTKDLLAFLLKAYKKVPDKDFSNYICAK